MAIVTFLSDFGKADHYVAAVKASILRENANLNIVDLSHLIELGDIGHGAYVLGAVFREFPVGTVHLVCIANPSKKVCKKIAIKLDGHLFVGEDTGLLSLISESRPTAIVDLDGFDKTHSTFSAKHTLGPVAAKLASGKDIQDFGLRLDQFNELMPSHAKATKKQIAGNIIRIDHYGNLITNILKTDFDNILKLNGNCPYEIKFRREKLNAVHVDYTDVGTGECFVIFNASGRLQVGINQGNGANLLGLEINDQIFIDFKLTE